MEQYTEKQQALFLDFYKACKSKGIDPQRSEADRQRALLLAEQNRDLVKLFGDRLDGAHVEAYRMGKEYETARTTARKEADQSAKIAEQRTVDEAAAALERSLAQALVAEGKYGAAISIFDALGDYEDSQTLAGEARLEERYQNAIALL